MKTLYTILFVTSIEVAWGQKLLLNESAKSYQDIDNNNWQTARTFEKGDTVIFVGNSVKEIDYIKVKDKAGQISFVYRTSVNEVDDYFEKIRTKMDSERKFVAKKMYDKIKAGDTVTIISAWESSSGQYRFVKCVNKTGDSSEVRFDDLNLNRKLENEAIAFIGESNAIISQERIKKLKV